MRKTQEKKPSKINAARKSSKRKPEEHDLLTDPGHPKAAGGGAGLSSAGEQKENLGDRVRKTRESRGLSLEDLASRTGISLETLRRVEANEAIPPLGELIKLGKAMEMKMGYFISPGVEKPMTVVRAHCRPAVSRFGQRRSEQYGYAYESLAAEKANRFMEPFLITMVPTEVEELSTHDGQEFIFILEGEIRAQVENQVEILHAGDAIYYDSSCPHLVKCSGRQPAKILAVLYTGTR